MSLFDILKYGNTDLNSKEELNKLPENLIKIYWVIANRSCSSSWNIKYWAHIDMCRTLSQNWADPYLPEFGKKALFDKALKEYDNEPI